MILLAQATSGWAHVRAENGLGIAVTGMAIVFAALTIICLIISVMPWLLARLATVFPEREHHSHGGPALALHSSTGPLVDEATAAAIANALRARRGAR